MGKIGHTWLGIGKGRNGKGYDAPVEDFTANVKYRLSFLRVSYYVVVVCNACIDLM